MLDRKLTLLGVGLLALGLAHCAASNSSSNASGGGVPAAGGGAGAAGTGGNTGTGGSGGSPVAAGKGAGKLVSLAYCYREAPGRRGIRPDLPRRDPGPLEPQRQRGDRDQTSRVTMRPLCARTMRAT